MNGSLSAGLVHFLKQSWMPVSLVCIRIHSRSPEGRALACEFILSSLLSRSVLTNLLSGFKFSLLEMSESILALCPKNAIYSPLRTL